jgi:hypothetical protein
LGAFCCDHIIEELFALALDEICPQVNMSHDESAEILWQAREKLRHMPRLIEVYPTLQAKQLEVSWVHESASVSSVYGAGIMYEVVLHMLSTCEAKQTEVSNLCGKC